MMSMSMIDRGRSSSHVTEKAGHKTVKPLAEQNGHDFTTSAWSLLRRPALTSLHEQALWYGFGCTGMHYRSISRRHL
jgi:hypothetical protein